MTFWDDILRQRAQDWIFTNLNNEQVPFANKSERILPSSGYLSVFLRSARIVNVRKGFKRFYGAVHSVMRLPHRSGKTAEFAVVVVPSFLKDLDAKHIDRVVQLDHRLLGPIPYCGGDLQMEVGLLSLASQDLTAPYLKLLESLSNKAGVAYFSSAMNFAQAIIEGINLLTDGSDDSILEIGFSKVQANPTTGLYAAIRASKNDLNINNIKVDPQDYRLQNANNEPLANYPYMLVEITMDPYRSDWYQIPELVEAYESIQHEFRKGRAQDTDEAIVAFGRIALTCNDLLENDARNLVYKLRKTYSLIGPPQLPFKRQRDKSYSFPDLKSLDLYELENS